MTSVLQKFTATAATAFWQQRKQQQQTRQRQHGRDENDRTEGRSNKETAHPLVHLVLPLQLLRRHARVGAVRVSLRLRELMSLHRETGIGAVRSISPRSVVGAKGFYSFNLIYL